jgi:hypothetical protein
MKLAAKKTWRCLHIIDASSSKEKSSLHYRGVQKSVANHVTGPPGPLISTAS